MRMLVTVGELRKLIKEAARYLRKYNDPDRNVKLILKKYKIPERLWDQIFRWFDLDPNVRTLHELWDDDFINVFPTPNFAFFTELYRAIKKDENIAMLRSSHEF